MIPIRSLHTEKFVHLLNAMAGGHGKLKGVMARRLVKKVDVSSARAALRTATHDIHERMHDHPALARLAAGTIGRDEYRRVLARSYGFYAMVQPDVGHAGELTDCLAQDLAELGMTAAAISDLPRCAPVVIADGHAEQIGACYVLLGASLGGKVMARAIAGRETDGSMLPVHFLTGTNENEWKAFAVGIEAKLPDADSRSRAARSAMAMFTAYEDWMAGHE